MKDLCLLFLAFAKIGLFTFGGGYAMLPMLQKEIVEKYDWATEQELLDYFAIGQCTPGVIAVNTATFIGYKKKRRVRWYDCYTRNDLSFYSDHHYHRFCS